MLINLFSFIFLLVARIGSCEIAFDVRRARRSRSTEGENIRADGSDKSAGGREYHFESQRLPRDTHQTDNGRANKNHAYGDPLATTNLVNLRFSVKCVYWQSMNISIYVYCSWATKSRMHQIIISLQKIRQQNNNNNKMYRKAKLHSHDTVKVTDISLSMRLNNVEKCQQ